VPVDASVFAGLTKLKSLKLHGAEMEDLQPLAKLRALETLYLLDPVSDVRPLEGLTALKELLFADAIPRDLSPLAGLPLRELTFAAEATKLKVDAVKALVSNEALKVHYKRRTWSTKDLHAFLAGTFKLPTLKDAARPAFPVKTKKGDGGALGSHFGGTPYLASGEKWPCCGNCERPMPLFVQLDLTKLELGPTVKGLLQFFYCNALDPQCEVDCKSWVQNDKAMLLRVVFPDANAPAIKAPKLPSPIVAKTIEIGSKKADSPTPDDALELFGIDDAPSKTQAGDKLLGWPAWLQSPEWPTCPDCSKRMDQVIQLESNKGLAFQWGDLGRAYLFLCADHPTRVGFLSQS
jgi:hypothetical protein